MIRSPSQFKAVTVCILLVLAFAGMTAGQETDDTSKAIALFNQGQDAHEKGELEKAITLYASALEIFPEFAEAELQYGSALVSLNRIDDAEKHFRRAVELRQDWTLATANLGSVLVTKRKFAEAEPLLVKAIEADDSNTVALPALIEMRLETNASQAVLRELLAKVKPLTEKVRPTTAIWSARAALELKLGDKAQARLSATRAIELDAKSKPALAIAAGLALDENDTARAAELIQKLEVLSPKTESTLALRSRLLVLQGKTKEAVATLESIEKPSSEVASMLEQIRTNDVVDTNVLEERLTRNPGDAYLLGRLCSGFRVKDPAKALDYCRRASEADPTNVSPAVGYGAALVQAKQYDAAVTLFRKLSTIAPENTTVRANLATALFQLKRLPEAKTEYQWLTAKQPTLSGAFYFLAVTHDQLGEYLDAMANYQQFIKLADPDASKLEIEKVNLRLPILAKQIKDGKGKKKS
jgi:tetratricopeptide (TPR) repeat protein